MTRFIVIAVFYFGFELVINGLIPSVELAARQSTHQSSQSSYNPWEEVIQQYYDLAIIVCILWVFRPRKWPEYFTVGLLDGEVSDVSNTISQIVEQYKVVPFFSTSIDQKLLHSSQFDSMDQADYTLNRSFKSDEQVLILNPCDYSRLSDGSAKEATPIVDEQSMFAGVGTTLADKSHKVAEENKPWEDSKKAKLFANMYIGVKLTDKPSPKTSP